MADTNASKIKYRYTHQGYLVNFNGKQPGEVCKRGSRWHISDVTGKGRVYAIQVFGKQGYSKRNLAAQALITHVLQS